MKLATAETERKRKRVAELSAAMIEQAAELRMLQDPGSGNAGLERDVGIASAASTPARSPEGQRVEFGGVMASCL